jgi:hypothetical protein
MSMLFVEMTFVEVGESWRSCCVDGVCVVIKFGMYECCFVTDSRFGKK